MKLLARREHSARELLWKLRGRGFPENLAQAVIEELQAAGWQDERRFVESFIRARSERGHGPVKIRFELRQKGIEDGLIEQVLAELAIDWEQVLETVYRRKFGERPVQSRNEYGKRYRFLAQRGFETEQIRSLLRD
ncbi:regulatory protein RecX [Methylohalobius crimeensis]|uniref:regulatory protein RecX n=1 Tax=Methylohalobius crimeensis TaxID=244365 RepID=UPI00389907B9